MGRPSATTILKQTDELGRVLEILEADKAYILTYDGKPTALRQTEHFHDLLRIRYPRTGFNNRAHAVRLANRLNKLFNTDLFSVSEL